MSNTITPNLRKIADNLDFLADRDIRHGHHRLIPGIRQNAAYLRRAADTILNTESAMGRFADKIHAVEKQRDDNLTRAIKAETALAQAGQAQVQLDALTTAGKIADDADVAALSDDTTGTDTTAGSAGGDATVPVPAQPADTTGTMPA